VIATDASAAQIAHAEPHTRVAYRVAPAEDAAAVGLAAGSADLATAAQAAHWFDHDRWAAEVRRVVRRGGVVAVWCYGLLAAGDDVQPLLRGLYEDVVGEDWPPERRLVEEGYRSLPFPFAEFGAPPFEMTARWTAADLAAYVGTWSAVTRHRSRTGFDPVEPLARELARRWPAGEARTVRWPLTVRAGRVE
jgi:hypothetical protein